MLPQTAPVLSIRNPIPVEQGFDLGFGRFSNSGDDQILIGRQTKIAFVNPRDFAQCRQPRHLGRVSQATAEDTQSQMPFAALVLHPAEAVARAFETERPGRFERPAEPRFQLGLEPRRASIIDRVFKASMLAVAPVAEIALHPDDIFRDFEQPIGRAKTDNLRKARIGCGFAVAHTHPAAHGDVKTDQCVIFGDGDESQVLSKNINVVVGGNAMPILNFRGR